MSKVLKNKIGAYIDQMTGFAFESSNFNQEKRGHRLLRGINITRGKLRFDNENEMFYEDDNIDFSKFHLKEKDIVISMDGSLVGRNYAMVNSEYLPLLLVQRVARLRADNTQLDQNYLYQFISSDYFTKYVDSVKTSSGIPHISSKQINEFEIPFFPIEEQKYIAKILSTCDELISNLQKLIDAKEKQKKGLMQNLLTGKVRFKKHNNNNWSYIKLGELSFIRRGASPRPISDPKFFSNEGRGWIRISDVSAEEGKYLNRTTQYLSTEGENNSVKVDKGDLIMSICATIGLPKVINIPSCIHDGFVLIKPIEGKLHTDFLYHYINFITDKLAEGGQPGTQKNLNTDIVSRIEVPFIEVNEQKEIANVLDHAESEILILNKELSQMRMQKKGLIQHLLTGKIRVKL